MSQVLTKNEGFGDFREGWVPFLLEVKQKAGWLVGMLYVCTYIRACAHSQGVRKVVKSEGTGTN